MRLSRSLVVAFGLTCAVALPASAVAAPDGSFSALAGPTGCATKSGISGCAAAASLVGATGIALSPDGLTLYAASPTGGALQPLAVDATTGGLTALSARPLAGVTAVVTSADGRFVYAGGNSTVSAFARQPDGTLAPIGCVATLGAGGCTASAYPIDNVTGLALSPDGAVVEVAAEDVDAIVTLNRDLATGLLAPIVGTTGCVAVAKPACAPGRGLDGVRNVAFAPDGRTLYAVSANAFAVVSLARDPTTNALTQPAGPSGCVSALTIADCVVAPSLKGASALAVNPNGAGIFVASPSVDAISWLSPALAVGGCLSTAIGPPGCGQGQWLDGVSSLAVRADGALLEAAGTKDDSITAYAIGPGGVLTPTAACIHNGRRNGCRPGRALAGVRGVALAANGTRMFVTSADGVAALGPQIAPVCTASAANVVANASGPIALACADSNGDPLTRILTAGPAHGNVTKIDPLSGAATYIPSPGYVGPDSVTFTATDGLDQAPPVVVTVTVTRPARSAAAKLLTTRTFAIRRRISVAFECPVTAIDRCKISVSFKRGGKTVGSTKLIIPRGRIGSGYSRLRQPGRYSAEITTTDGSGAPVKTTGLFVIRPLPSR